MIEQLITEVFERIGHTWKTSQGFIAPDEEDVSKLLDAAAKRLYDSGVATQFCTGGLIIEKAEKGHDVYVYVGNYQ